MSSDVGVERASNSSSRSSSATRPITSDRQAQDLSRAGSCFQESYEPTGLPTMLCSIIPSAVNELLEQHQNYNLHDLANFLGAFFPEIPAKYREVVVLSATAAANRAASLHILSEKNKQSHDPMKRRVAAEAASTLSFWGLGLRPPMRSSVSQMQPQAGNPEETETVNVAEIL